MGTSNVESEKWFDLTGEAAWWKLVPLRTVKKAIFRKGNTVRTLMKMILNGVTYDFSETAKGGAVIVPPDYSAIEFIAPDGHFDYQALLNGTLGEALDAMVEVLSVTPIPAWDRFCHWFGSQGIIEEILAGVTCELQVIGETASIPIGIPDFSTVTNTATFFQATKLATVNANNRALSAYRIDTAAFGFSLVIKAVDEDGAEQSIAVGFIFRE